MSIRFEEINLKYPDGTIKEVDEKFMHNEFKIATLKKIAFDNNISLTDTKQLKTNIIKRLMEYSDLQINL